MKKVLAFLVISIFSAGLVFAQDAPPAAAAGGDSAPAIEVGLDIASSYIWRGGDLYINKFAADAADEGAFNAAPSAMPSITALGPGGLSFNIWMAWALTGREPADGELKTADEVDYTVSWEWENKAGAFGASYIMYTYPTGGNNYSEIALSYGADMMLSPSLGIALAENDGGNTSYYTLGFSHAIESGAISFEPGVTFAYWYFNSLGTDDFAHIDIALPLGYAISDSTSVALTPLAVYRVFSTAQKTGVVSTADRPPVIASVTLGVSSSF